GRHIAWRRWAFFDAENRLTGHAIQNENPTRFACLRQRGDLLPILYHFEEAWRRGKVIVPEFMMDRLEIPLELSAFGIERRRGIAVQGVARPVAPVVVRSRLADRKVHDAALLVDGEPEGPDVVSGAVLPTLECPCFVARFALARNCMKFPKLLSG